MWNLSKQAIMRRPLIAKTNVAIKFILFWQKKTGLLNLLIGVIVFLDSEKSQTCNRHKKTALWGFYFIVSLQFSPTSRVESTANKNVNLPLPTINAHQHCVTWQNGHHFYCQVTGILHSDSLSSCHLTRILHSDLLSGLLQKGEGHFIKIFSWFCILL